MKRASSTISISLVCFVLCSFVRLASAEKSAAKQDDCQARPACAELLAKGIKDYQQKHYSEAMTGFEKALKLSNDPRILMLLGRTNFKLDNARAALGYYERAADQNMSAVDRAKLEQYVAEAKAVVEAEKPVPVVPIAPPPPPPKEEKKMKPWMWAIIGVAGAAVVGTAIGVGVYYGTSKPTPDMTLRFP